ncbi:hypothetical protein PBY51_020546 [Eleginops maclovinus]|uniref:Uncharacterized protein n=1 Tax=Eleginops maclovinus TaxID=56733 RepID=A0AAN7XS51_ELEMC|nr:hypothetical protein PBY51_020546 [Eleginops maclovinus]
MLCWLEQWAHSGGSAIEDKLTDDGFVRGGGLGGGWWGEGWKLVVLRGDATSVSPEAQSPNGYAMSRGKRHRSP